MKHSFFLGVALLFISVAQAHNVSIGTTIRATSAKLDTTSPNKSIQRMKSSQRKAIPASSKVKKIPPTILDRVVNIGTQTWMQKNLDVTTYRNGDPIPNITNQTEWGNLKTGAWCWYNNDSTTYSVYGRLYNWYAVADSRGLAPVGWHLPSNDEWITLRDYLGGKYEAGNHLKEAGLTHWAHSNESTNSTGWTGLPGGWRVIYSGFDDVAVRGYWWSSNQAQDRDPRKMANSWFLVCADSWVHWTSLFKSTGLSVRCIKD